MKNFVITSLLLLIAASSGAVSRVGGGKVSSQSSGFTLNFDSSYSMTDISNGVRASGDNAFVPGLGMVSKFFEITEFKTEYPKYESLNRDTLLQELTKLGWSEMQTNFPCALGIRKSNRTSLLLL